MSSQLQMMSEKKHQQEKLKSVSGPLLIIGDERCNSPWFSAKYGTVTIRDQNADKILDIQFVQVDEVATLLLWKRQDLKGHFNVCCIKVFLYIH